MGSTQRCQEGMIPSLQSSPDPYRHREDRPEQIKSVKKKVDSARCNVAQLFLKGISWVMKLNSLVSLSKLR